MLALPPLDRAIDHLAIWLEDRISRPSVGYRPAGAGPLAVDRPLPAGPDEPPAVADRWTVAGPADGDPIEVRVRRAVGPRRGVAILVPPWKIRRARTLDAWSRALSRAGWEVWFYVPPHHLSRARGGRSGEELISPDLGAVRASFEQLVVELRILVAAARARQRGAVALVGLSMGALAAAFAATAPERADAAVLVAPPDLFTSFVRTRIGDRYRGLARRARAPLPHDDDLAVALRPFSPAGRRPTAGRILVATGAHDVIVPPCGPGALARAWAAEERVYPRGHVTLLLACPELRRDAVRFLAGACGPRGADCADRA